VKQQMPNIDSSAYTRKQRLTIVKKANDAANQNKFRALTVFDRYDPSLVNTTAVVCNDSCRITVKSNNTFEAKVYARSKVPHFN
jgi:hypothetical protein